jgi:phosphatidylglycerophosphate synthase
MPLARINRSLLAAAEGAAIAFLVRRVPARVAPDHLTALGLFGGLLTAIGFLACRWSNGFVAVVVLGLFLNWLGDSLDGALARHRGVERPHYGLLLDHSVDLFAHSAMIVCLGLSPFFTPFSALLVLSLYALGCAYTYLHMAAANVHRLSYGAMGGAEFRLLLAVWAVVAAICGPAVATARLSSLIALDLAIAALSVIVSLCFVFVAWRDLKQLASQDSEPRALRHGADASLQSSSKK